MRHEIIAGSMKKSFMLMQTDSDTQTLAFADSVNMQEECDGTDEKWLSKYQTMNVHKKSFFFEEDTIVVAKSVTYLWCQTPNIENADSQWDAISLEKHKYLIEIIPLFFSFQTGWLYV